MIWVAVGFGFMIILLYYVTLNDALKENDLLSPGSAKKKTTE